MTERARRFPIRGGRLRRIWGPALAVLAVLAFEARLQDTGWVRREPLVSITVPATNAWLRFGAAEVDIDFTSAAWPSTLQVSLRRIGPDGSQAEIDMTDDFVARENGAVGNLTGLTAGRYTIRARVFGRSRGRADLLVEEDVSVTLLIPPLPILDRA
jgi:hypothetical protein